VHFGRAVVLVGLILVGGNKLSRGVLRVEDGVVVALSLEGVFVQVYLQSSGDSSIVDSLEVEDFTELGFDKFYGLGSSPVVASSTAVVQGDDVLGALVLN